MPSHLLIVCLGLLSVGGMWYRVVLGARLNIEVKVDESADTIVCTYRRSKDASSAKGGVEWSVDAASWSTDGVTRTVIEDLGDAWLIDASVPIGEGDDAKFLRLRVER